jgi:hypothetical protein
MSDTGEIDNNRPAASAEQIRSFLLGKLTSNEQARLAESLFTDQAFEEQVRLAECELADDYAFQRLSAAERELFEKNFLVTGERQRQLTVSTALRSHLATKAALDERQRSRAAVSVSGREKLSSWLGFNRPALAYVFALILLVVFGSVVWRAVKNRRARQQNIARQEQIAKQHPASTVTPESNHVNQPSPAPEQTHTPKPTPPPAGPSVLATVQLQPSATHDSGQMSRITLPGEPLSDSIVRLELVLEAVEPGSYSAELLNVEGVSVYSVQQLSSSVAGSRALMVFEVPARLLKSGDYQVKLNIVGGAVTSGRQYYFRVTH